MESCFWPPSLSHFTFKSILARFLEMLFRPHRLAFAIPLFLSLWVEAYTATRWAIDNPVSFEDKRILSCNQETKIESIWRHPEAFQGQKVLVRGRYLGWRGQIEHPHITRSDWAIEDDTGAIYVTGLPAKGLDPVQDIGHLLEVLGTVGVSPKDVPYIRAERVAVEKGE
jgi:hypothetical protein